MTEIETLRAILSPSRRAVFFGGASMSTESGIPDFRSAGTWRKLVRQTCIQKIGSEGSIPEPIAHIKITRARCYTVLRLLYFTYSFFH